MSAQEREESLAWLGSLWGSYQSAVTEARGMPATALQDYADQTVERLTAAKGDTAAVALSSGLVTELKTRTQVEERLVQLTGEDDSTHSFRGVHHTDYLNSIRSQRALTAGDHDRVGVIVASGEILDGLQPPGTIGGDSTAELLRQARFDDRVRAVVLRIDSPGGSVFASEVIRREVEAIKLAGKPVVASMSSVAASGGYYIAMDADQIWASPATLTGSIGVFSVFPTIDRTLAKVGVSVDGVGTTELADAFRLDRKLGEEPKQLLQMTVDHEYRSFVERVAAGRGKPADEIDAVAQGRVWSGKDALRVGLVDELGSFRDALDAAAKRADLGDDYHVEYIEPPMSWRQLLAQEVRVLAGRAIRAIAPQDNIATRMRKVLSPFEAELTRLSRLMQSRGTYYYCLCSME
jgi:protease-4